MLHEVEEALQDLSEAFAEDELISHSHHKRIEKTALLVRNIAALISLVLFILSLFALPFNNIIKAIAYFSGTVAYFCEIMLLTDCFSKKVPHSEIFMAYCFGPLYLIMGLSYLIG